MLSNYDKNWAGPAAWPSHVGLTCSCAIRAQRDAHRPPGRAFEGGERRNDPCPDQSRILRRPAARLATVSIAEQRVSLEPLARAPPAVRTRMARNPRSGPGGYG